MKKTGKLVAIVLAIGLIIGMIISNTTSANDVSAAVENTQVNVGDDVVVTISGNNIVQIVNLTFKYEGDVFSGVEGTYTMTGETSEKAGNDGVVTINNSDKTVTIGFNAEEAVDANTQSIQNIKLKFHTNKEGTSKISLEEGSTIRIKGDDNDVRDATALSMEQQEITINGTQETKKLTITPASAEVEVGNDVQFTCSASDGDTEGIVWSLNPSSLATMGTDGTVTGLKPGEVEIKVSKEGYEDGVAKLTVKEKATPENPTLIITPASAEVNVGGNVQFTCSASDGNTEGIKWSSSDTSLATIDENGNAIGVKAGNVTITANKDGYEEGKAVLKINDNSDPTPTPTPTYPIPVVPASIEMRVNESYTINISNSDKITSGIKSWTSDNTSVAKVNNGVVTAVGVGTATITVTTNDGMTGTTKVTVTAAEDTGSSRPVLTPASMTITEGYTITIKSDKPVKWELGNEGVVQIVNSDTTQVTLQALKKGQAMITATSTADETQQATANIEVIEKTVEYGTSPSDGGNANNGGTANNGGSQGNSRTGGATTQNTSSSANEAVPATGESSVETIAILVIATLFIAAIVPAT